MKRMPRAFLVALAGLLVLAPVAAPAAPPPDVQKFEKSFPFVGEKEQKIGIKTGDVVIESVKILGWPDAEDFQKGEKDLNDTKMMWVVFTYTNRGDRDYKCKYTVSVLDPKGDKPFAVDDATRTLDRGKVDDTNRFGMKMKTHLYKVAKSFKVTFEVWKK
jgi:hypothetical protein